MTNSVYRPVLLEKDGAVFFVPRHADRRTTAFFARFFLCAASQVFEAVRRFVWHGTTQNWSAYVV